MKLTITINHDKESKFSLNVKDGATNNEIKEHVECYTNDWSLIKWEGGELEKVKCICGAIELAENIEYDEDGNPACRQCAAELKTDYVVELAKNAADKNKN